MSFSTNWEKAYSDNKHFSIWPWSSLVSMFYKVYDESKKLKVLELGCGAGANVNFFKFFNNVQYFGLDGSNTAINFLKDKYPSISKNFKVADFTKDLMFDEKFDVIFDRASLTHNSYESVYSAIKLVEEKLVSSGYFIGVDWFSTSSSYRNLGVDAGDNGNTRKSFSSGPFVGIDPVHFFSKEEIFEIFHNFDFIFLQHSNYQTFDLENSVSYEHTGWNFIVKMRS